MTTWDTAGRRYEVASSLVKYLEAVAVKHEVPLDALVSELVRQGDSIAKELTMYGDDAVGFQWGTRFYGFKWRVTDAVKGAQRDEVARLWAIEVARQEALGNKVCDRCGSAGGFAHWPGFNCFDCDGRKFVPAS